MYILFPEFLSQQLQCTNYDILLGLPNFLSLFFIFYLFLSSVWQIPSTFWYSALPYSLNLVSLFFHEAAFLFYYWPVFLTQICLPDKLPPIIYKKLLSKLNKAYLCALWISSFKVLKSELKSHWLTPALIVIKSTGLALQEKLTLKNIPIFTKNCYVHMQLILV